MGISLKPDEIVCTEDARHFSIHKHSYYVVKNSYGGTFGGTQNSNVFYYDIPVYSDFGMAYAGIFEISVLQNPNGGGSTLYSSGAQMTVFCTTTWHGSGYTPQITYDNTDWNTTGASHDAVIYSNGTVGTAGEYQTSLNTAQSGGAGASTGWGSTGFFLRIKQTNGFNTSYRGHHQIQVIGKCCY